MSDLLASIGHSFIRPDGSPRKEKLQMKLRAVTTTTTNAPPEKAKRMAPSLVQVVVIVLVLIAAVVTGVAYVSARGGPTHYACLAIKNNDGTVTVTTTGLLHYVSDQYYVSCNEGSPLPTSGYSSACLSITPQTVPAKIGVGAATEYYYLSSSGGHPIRLQGASPMSNGDEIINTAGISLVTDCQ